jgi:hypothetical protein
MANVFQRAIEGTTATTLYHLTSSRGIETDEVANYVLPKKTWPDDRESRYRWKKKQQSSPRKPRQARVAPIRLSTVNSQFVSQVWPCDRKRQ